MTAANPLPPPAGFKLKLARARKHLRHLRRVVERHIASNPLSYRREKNADGTYYQYSMQIVYGPTVMELLADEAVHHLRSVLDHVVCATVEASGKTVTRMHAFPIFRTEPKTPEEVGRYNAMVKDLSPEARVAIDSVQPYQRGKDADSHPLAILGRLDNRFKHTSLHLLSYQMRSRVLPGIIQPPAGPRGRDSGDVFAEVPVSIDVEKDFEPFISAQVAFRTPATGVPDVGLDTLESIYNYVRDEIVGKAVRGYRLPRRL